MSEYYTGTKLLSMLDINGKKPELYLCTTNRTGGKTTYFGRLCVNKFINNNEKFLLLYRFNYELDNIADKFFKDLQGLFFSEYEMTSKRCARGLYQELFLNDKSCGYALALNNADQIKRYSHMFSDVERILMDEFQSETNHYCADEVKKLISIHTSIARGQGKQVRRVPVYMLSNAVSIINPYYVSLNISSRLKNDTKFLKGDGFVLEQGYVDSASKQQLESGFNRAFKNDNYVVYSSQNVYLNDNNSFIEKPEGRGKYLATIKYKGECYGIKEYAESGYIYCDNKPDMSFPLRITVTTNDHDINYVMLKKNDFFISNLRFLFEKGCFRFKDMMCKTAILNTLSY